MPQANYLMHAKYVVIALTLLCIVAIAPTQAKYIEDIPVAPINTYHSYPCIYEDTVVWVDFTNSHDVGLYGLYLEDGTVFTIMDTYGSNESPGAVYGAIAVWERGTPPQTFDIMGKNLLTGTSFTVAGTSKTELDPDISGSIVVCEVNNTTTSYDIYAYDISWSYPYAAIPVCMAMGVQQNPAIHDNLVVWQDNRNGNDDIYGCYIVDGVVGGEFPICTLAGAQTYPAVHGDIVVWADSRNGDTDIYGYNVTSGSEFPVAVAAGTQTNPAIYGNYVVYESYQDGDCNIYGCDIRTGEIFQITSAAGTQNQPDIYGSTVVWQDISATPGYINGAVIHDNSGSVSTSAQPLVTTHLARALSQWAALLQRLPADLSDEQAAALDAIQALMEQAASIANPIHASGLLQQAMALMSALQ